MPSSAWTTPAGVLSTIPVWYSYVPGGTVNVITGGQSVKAQLLRAAGRFSLCVQNESMPYRYVSVEGPITAMDETVSDDERRALAHRYLGAEGGDLYVASTAEQAAGSVAFRMSPERWRTSDYGKLGYRARAPTPRCAGVAQVVSNGPTGRPTASPQLLRGAGWPRLSGDRPALSAQVSRGSIRTHVVVEVAGRGTVVVARSGRWLNPLRVHVDSFQVPACGAVGSAGETRAAGRLTVARGVGAPGGPPTWAKMEAEFGMRGGGTP